MKRTSEERSQTAKRAWQTRREKAQHETWQEAGRKAWGTRKKKKLRKRQREIGQKSALKQKERILAVREFLTALKGKRNQQDSCVVCGDSMKNTLDTHHLDGNSKNNDPSNIVTLCASCHRIIDKAKSPEEALSDFRARVKYRAFMHRQT